MNRALFFLCVMIISITLDARLYFTHVPKTGGTTLRHLLELQLSTTEIYPCRNIKADKKLNDEILVSGHFPCWFCKKLDEHFDEAFKVTVLRDPVERYLSFLRAKLRAFKEFPDLESVLRTRHTERFYEDLKDNALCRYFAAEPDLDGEQLLQSAKQTLEGYDCIIFFDNFSKDVSDLFQHLGIDLEINEIPKINTTTARPASTQLLEEIRNMSELDIQLYDFAKNLPKKNSRFPLRTSSFDYCIKKTTEINYTFDLPLKGTGWTYREALQEEIAYPMYRWIMSNPAEIHFSLEKGNDYILNFNAWLLNDQIVPQVFVNDSEIILVRLNTEKFSHYQGIIPKELINENSTKLTFYSDKTFQFRDFYSTTFDKNYLPLAFAINRIQINSLKYP